MEPRIKPRRHRSSTTRSHIRPAAGQETTLDAAVKTLTERAHKGHASSVDQIHRDLLEVDRLLASSPGAEFLQDRFRRASGFEAVLDAFRVVNQSSAQLSELAHSALSVYATGLQILLQALHDHEGNRRYFTKRVLKNGWKALENRLVVLQRVILLQLSSEKAWRAFYSLLSSLLTLAYGNKDHTIDLNQLGRPPVSSNSIAVDGRHGTPNEVLGDPVVLGVDKALLEEQLPLEAALLNPEVVQIIATLYSTLPPSTASRVFLEGLSATILVSLQLMVEASLRNKIALHSAGLLSLLLSHLLVKSVSQPEALLLETICSALLSLGVSKLDDAALLFHKAATSQLARGLLQTALARPKEPPCIQFDLSQSGYSSIEIPSMPRNFPPTSGYSLTAWVRIDEFDPDCHTTIFGAFDSSQTCFVLVYLEKDTHQLILQSSVISSKPSVRFRAFRFQEGSWYHIAVVHYPHHHGGPKGAALFVNGEFVEQKKESVYPSTPPTLHPASAGGTLPPGTNRRSIVQSFFGTPQDLAFHSKDTPIKSRWSLSNAYLYDVCLSDEIIKVHHKLGASYTGNFQDFLGQLLTYRASAELNLLNEALHPEKGEKSELSMATQQRGSDVLAESKLLLAFSASAAATSDGLIAYPWSSNSNLSSKAAQQMHVLTRNGNTIIFNAARPAFNDALARQSGAAVLTGSAVTTIPKSLDDASWRLSGTLALATRLVQSATSPGVLLDAFNIYLLCIETNWRISEAMEKENGYGALTLLLRDKLGSHSALYPGFAPVSSISEERDALCLTLLRRILTFVGYDHEKPENSVLINAMAYRAFLVDLEIWRHGSTEVQRLYYQQLAFFVHLNKHQAFNAKRLSKMRVLRRLLDSFKSESLNADVLPEALHAYGSIFGYSATHLEYRELAAYIAYTLQDASTMAGSMPLGTKSRPSSLHPNRKRTGRAASLRAATSAEVIEGSNPKLSTSELGVRLLQAYTAMLCEQASTAQLWKSLKLIQRSWLLRLVAESDVRVVNCALQIIARATVLVDDPTSKCVDPNTGFLTIKHHLRVHWSSAAIWTSCFAVLFGRDVATIAKLEHLTHYYLAETFSQKDLQVKHPEVFPTIATMLEAGLRAAVSEDDSGEDRPGPSIQVPQIVIRFLADVHGRSQSFRDFAAGSQFVQELLFVLYPVIASADRLSASAELAANGIPLNFNGQDVFLRPHSNSAGERPKILRSGSSRTLPEQAHTKRVQAPRRPSSFVFVNPTDSPHQVSAHFNPIMSPARRGPVRLRVGNAVAESLLELIVSVFVDQICSRKDFVGFGLFLKVPPGFQEHQAYFESYVLLHSMYQLWNHLQLNQQQLLDPKVLTNLARYCLHMAEAVFEGWFIDGAQPLLDFTGKVLDYLQQPQVANVKSVRLCTPAITSIRSVFLRVTLLRLSELDDTDIDGDALEFLRKLNYWQTILFSPDNQEVPFIRLLCYLLYTLLISPSEQVRLAAAPLFRMLLVQKPTEAATILIQNADSDQRHLSTGLMKLSTQDDEELLLWVHDRRALLDKFFLETLSRYWQEFVNNENQKTEETAKNRLGKRREKLKQWQIDEAEVDNLLHRFDSSKRHWRVNIHAQERLRCQRALQDQQENITHMQTVVSHLDRMLRQPSGLFADTGPTKWQLDRTEARNRMRMRIVPDRNESQGSFESKQKASERLNMERLRSDTAPQRLLQDDLMPDTPVSSTGPSDDPSLLEIQPRPTSDSTTLEALLEGDFEMVDDPRDDEADFEDKNRKVMRSLQRGEKVQHLYNVSRIVGLEACEGLLIVGKHHFYLQDGMFQRSDGEIVSIAQGPSEERDHYVQMISGKKIQTEKTQQRLGGESARHWGWSEVLSLSKRRFLFRDVAIEVFFTDGRSYLLTFIDPHLRNEVYSNMSNKAPHVHSSSPLLAEDAWRLDTLRNPEETPQTFGSKFANVFNSTSSNVATRKWSRGEISNFQYLMLINTMAGRTFNDLTQYPVFPWVLADYTSEELDLSNRRSFRDLSKPMGCQHPAREAEFRDRYQSFAEMGEEQPFHYGTHYSSAMIVTSYLIRLQPFVQSYMLLQGGVFDHADRLFDSLEQAWESASRQNMTDVRELTPEFFYLPEFLSNINGYDFGSKQGSDQAINDVNLPPWAKGDPHLFIAKHREALESPFVSEHLHEWIDLVFGYKQRGDAAFEATNLFHPLSYHGAKDLDTIDDPVERLATIGIIHNFGQTPHQVFQRAHARSEAEKHKVARLDTLVETLTRLPSPLAETQERVASLYWSVDKDRLYSSPPGMLKLPPSCKRYIQWGFADHSLRAFSSDGKKPVGLYEQLHIGPISAVLVADSRTLVTGGADCTIGVWDMTSTSDSVDLHPRTYLFGHRTPVTALAASRALSSLVSVSADGHVLLWDLNRFDCIRVILPARPEAYPDGATTAAATTDTLPQALPSLPITIALINNVTGRIALCHGGCVSLYTLNGHLLVLQNLSPPHFSHHHGGGGSSNASETGDEITAAAFYEGVGNEWVGRELLFTGHRSGTVQVHALVALSDGAWYLSLMKTLVHGEGTTGGGGTGAGTGGAGGAAGGGGGGLAITSVLPKEKTVFTGDEAGRVWEWDCIQRHSRR